MEAERDTAGMVDPVRIGKRLADFRERAGVNQDDAAKHVGIAVGTLSKHENGHWLPKLREVILYAELYKCTLDDLVGAVKELPGTTRDETLHFLDMDVVEKARAADSLNAVRALIVTRLPFGVRIRTTDRQVDADTFERTKEELRRHIRPFGLRLE